MTTYSFLDLSGAFTHPSVGIIPLNGGNIGLGQVKVMMATEKTAHNVASDGTIMVTFRAGDNGSVEIEVQQTSLLHDALLNWYNTVKTAALAGNVTQWATAAITLRNIVDQTAHQISGISPSKLPDKIYGAEGAMMTWTLMAADSQQVTA